MAFNKKISNFLTKFVKKGPKFSKTETLTGSQRGVTFFRGYIWSKSPNPFRSLPIIEVFSRSPESKINLPNLKNVDGNLIFFISISDFPWRFFPNLARKSVGSKDLTFSLFTL